MTGPDWRPSKFGPLPDPAPDDDRPLREDPGPAWLAILAAGAAAVVVCVVVVCCAGLPPL